MIWILLVIAIFFGAISYDTVKRVPSPDDDRQRFPQPGLAFIAGFCLGPLGLAIAWMMRIDRRLTSRP